MTTTKPLQAKAIILIDPVTEWRPVLRAALKLNYQVIAIQMPDLMLSERMKKFLPTIPMLKQAGIHHVVSMVHRDVFSSIQQLQILAQTQQNLEFCAVIPLSELAVDVSDLIAACLGLPHNPLELVTCRRDKGLMKQAVAHRGLKVAKFARISSLEEVKAVMKQLELSYPVVIKTPQGFSTTDVYICSSVETAQTAIDSIVSKIGPDGRTVSDCLLEEYIVGTEFAVNLMAYSCDQIQVTDVWKYQKNSQARYGSAEICNPNKHLEIVEYAKQVARAVGIHYGAAHVELKAKEDRNGNYVDPVIIEVGARLSGGQKATLSKAAIDDWDPFKNLILSHCGNGVPSDENATNRAPARFVRHIFLPIEQAGQVRSIEVDTASLTSLHSSAILAKEGDVVSETTDITSCAGFVWLLGERAKVDEETKHLLSTFKVVVD